MVEIRTWAEIIVVIALMTSLGINITDEDAVDNIYSCDIESVNDMYCFKLSKINNAGIQRNCYYNKELPRKYKVCSTGWEKITLEEALNKEPEIIEKIIYEKVSADLSQWRCSHKGCEPIK